MYDAALFVHLLGVAMLIAAVTTSLLVTVRAQTAATRTELRVLAAVTRKIDVVIGPAMLFILAAGLYMVSRHGDDGGIKWSSGWVDVSIVVFAVMSILGPTVESGHAKRLLAEAEAAPDGPITGELHALRRAQFPLYVSFFGYSQILAFLYLMTNKPGFGGAITACVVAAVIAVAIAALRLRRLPAAGPPDSLRAEPAALPAQATAPDVTSPARPQA